MDNKMVMEVNLEALKNVQDINKVLDYMGLDRENHLVNSIQTSVEDLQKRKSLLAFLETYEAPVIYLNLSVGGE